MNKIAGPCPDCPNGEDTCRQKYGRGIGIGEAAIIIKNDGGVAYAFISEDASNMDAGQRTAYDMQQYHPVFNEAVANCPGPQTATVSRKGLLGRIGLQKTEVSCPSIAVEIGDITPGHVDAYFGPDPVDQIQAILELAQQSSVT